ncbi:unnamed protein product [Diatraea saccharalis]|uniref:Uncharacterized protein n=1 Tax=Diatraea saccharalis TaxID=40085 RepID=A0A9N9WAB0_9NEOP|nr:unnamed protein product [Diatraea saccharalis]
MSQDVCHRPRRSLNEFLSTRAKNTRAEHATVKSCASEATLREAVPAPAPMPGRWRGPQPQMNLARKFLVLSIELENFRKDILPRAPALTKTKPSGNVAVAHATLVADKHSR